MVRGLKGGGGNLIVIVMKGLIVIVQREWQKEKEFSSSLLQHLTGLSLGHDSTFNLSRENNLP